MILFLKLLKKEKATMKICVLQSKHFMSIMSLLQGLEI